MASFLQSTKGLQAQGDRAPMSCIQNAYAVRVAIVRGSACTGSTPSKQQFPYSLRQPCQVRRWLLCTRVLIHMFAHGSQNTRVSCC